MTSFDDLNKKRQRILIQFHTLRAKNPQGKKYLLIRETAKRTGYVLDKKNQSSSYVMRVIREWKKNGESSEL